MELLRAIESIRSPFLDTVFGLITRFGEEMILIVVFCTLFWCVNKRMGYVLGVSFFLSSLAVQGLKIVFRVPRPWVADPTFQPVQGAVREATGYAFPSGHTQNAAALLGGLGAQLRQRPIKIVLFTIAILVGVSRLYLGVHYLFDVVASLVITFAIVFFAVKVVTDEPVSKKREFLLSLFIASIALVVIAIAAYLYHNGISTPSQLRDSTRAAGAAIGFAIGMYIERIYIRFPVEARNISLQVLKVALGIAGLIAVQEGVRLVGGGLIMDAVRYFLMVLWIAVGFPLIIKRFWGQKA